MGDSGIAELPITGDGLEAALRAARAFAESRNYPAAIDRLRQALARDPDCARAHHLLGLYLYLTGQQAEALAACRHGLALTPNDSVAHRVLGVVLSARRRDRRQGLDHFHNAVALAPEDGLNHYFLARGYAGLGRRRLAEASFKAACTRAPDDPAILVGYAEFLFGCGRRSEARDLAGRALALAPDDYQILAANALIALREGKTAAARDLAIASLSQHATYAPAVEVLIEADMRRNPAFALWSSWRNWCTGRPGRAVLSFFCLWAGCNLGILACSAMDPGLSTLPVFGFAGLMLIAWTAPRLLRRRVRRELRNVRLNKHF
jgi:tetratricopeptide (TPR) repeat protein